jgi:uncharacterized membrane protein
MMLLLTIFYLIWLIAVLIFLFLIWWSTTRYIRKMEDTMIQSRAISAQAALKSAEAASRLAEMLEEKEHHA